MRAMAETTIIDMTEPVSVILTNESQGFATDIDRVPLENLEFYTDIIVYRGDTELTDFSVGSVASANGITVTVNKNRVAFSINTSTAITADNGTFIIPVNVEGTIISRIFSWSCSKQGKSAISYSLEASTLAIKKGYDNVFAPASITFSSFYRIGTNAERIAYPGRFVISESTDGISYTDQYSSTTSELSTEYTPSSTDVKTIKCVLYAAGSNINALDTQSVVVLTDVDNIQPDLDKLKEELKTEISGVKSEVDKANKKITDEVWKDTIIETKDADGNTVQTTIENLLIQNTTDLNGIHTTLSDVQTVVNGSEDGSTIGLAEKVTTIEETVDGVETTVTEKYAELDGKISNTNTQVEQNADTITATAKKADDNGEEIASLKLTTQGLEATVNSKNQTFSGEDNPNYSGEGNIQPLFTNLVDSATDDSGNIYNSTGYQDGMRWSQSGGKETSLDGGRITGWMPYTSGATYRIKNIYGTGYCAGYYFIVMSSDGTITVYSHESTNTNATYDATTATATAIPTHTGVKFRISGYKYDEPPIITCNEEIAYGEAGATGNPNSPSVEWKANGTESAHVGDLYVDTLTGYLYRWELNDDEYSWVLVKDSDINDAAKTATNFLSFGEDGLQVGNKTNGSWEGCRTQMTNEAFKILDADGTELASYGADLVELGKDKQTSIQISNEGYKIVDISGIELASFNSDEIKLGALSEDACIELCGGLGSITYYQDGVGRTGLEISSNETVSINSGKHSSVSVDYLETDDSNVVTSIARSGFDASPSMARLYFEEDELDENGGILNTWVAHVYAQRGKLNLEADNINLETPVVNARYELSAQQIRLNNMLLSSFVTETDTDGIWTYRKWSDGTAECWGQYTTTMNFTGSSGVTGLLVGDVGLETDFPTGLFVETPRCYSKYHGASKSGTTYASFDYIASDTLSSTHTHKISILRIGGTVSGLMAKADFYAIGKWTA